MGPTFWNLSCVLEKTRDLAGAIEAIEEFIKLVPDDEDGPSRLAELRANEA